jgi:hypothetical protein
MSETFSNRPYKGADSFQAEDAPLFFGRELAAEDVVTRILSSRCTLLHARSGTGKTSLINARIIPKLEQRGCSPSRVTPQDDPLMAVRAGVIQHLLPPVGLEVEALRTARECLCADLAAPTLDDLFARYDSLHVSDPSKRRLIRPLRWTGHEPGCEAVRAGVITPFFCRLLRDSTTVEAFQEHCRAIASFGSSDTDLEFGITKETKVEEIAKWLARAEMREAFCTLLQQIDTPLPGLRAFFENVTDVYGSHRCNFSIVLIFDQFEELFTRYVDLRQENRRDCEKVPDWRLRKQLLTELEEIYLPPVVEGQLAQDPEQSCAKAALPVRLVISMRSEYICELDQLPRLVPELDRTAYRLSLLQRDAARVAMAEPAKSYGYTYSDQLVSEVITDLSHYYLEIETAPLQIVCDKLWDEAQKRFSPTERQDGEVSAKPVLGLSVYEQLGRWQGIMRAYLAGVLIENAEERLEILEMLEQLVTVSGTRNIIERTRLVEAMFRDAGRRAMLLDRLIDAKVVRCEVRHGGEFVEITHEFLIQPIQQAIAQELHKDPEYGAFRRAISTLEDLRHADRVDSESPRDVALSRETFTVLDKNIEKVEWDAWAREVMLRSTILNESDRASIGRWVKRVADSGSAPRGAAA